MAVQTEATGQRIGTTFFTTNQDKADHDYTNVFCRSSADVVRYLSAPLAEARVLCVGCGYTYPDVVLYSNVARTVVGLDVLSAFYRDGWFATLRDRLAKVENPLRAVRQTIKRRKGMSSYYGRLAALSGRRVEHRSYRLISYDGSRMPFDDGSFDLVISNATLEHVHNLGQFFGECARVTAPGGVSYHAYHNYYSWSGGHIASRAERERAPWGHLRGIHQPSPGLLNQVTKEAITAEFARWFAVERVVGLDACHRPATDPDFTPERPDLLTPGLRAELKAYSDEALLTKTYLLVGVKA